MSKEFEEIVLKKLDNLENGLKDNNQRLGKLEKEAQNTKHSLQNLTTRVEENTQRLGKLDMEIKDTGEVVNYLNQNFTKFDYEINKKIDTLFDAFTTNKEKNLLHENNILSLDEKVFKHDIRISNLEDKVLTA